MGRYAMQQKKQWTPGAGTSSPTLDLQHLFGKIEGGDNGCAMV